MVVFSQYMVLNDIDKKITWGGQKEGSEIDVLHVKAKKSRLEFYVNTHETLIHIATVVISFAAFLMNY